MQPSLHSTRCINSRDMCRYNHKPPYCRRNFLCREMAVHLTAQLVLQRDAANRSDSDTDLIDVDSDLSNSETTIYPQPPEIQVKPLDEAEVKICAERFVCDVLDYCHREDFPYALIFTASETVGKALTMSDSTMNAPIKKLTQNDTTFEFAIADVDLTSDVYMRLFGDIKPSLNRYRKVQCL